MSCNNPIIQAITVDDFKTKFYRDFTYINNWDILTTYNVGDKVFYDVNNKFYQCLNSAVLGVVPTNNIDWKNIEPNDLISDLDITNAFAEACISFNDSLFSDSDDMILGYLYLTAHFLVNDLNAGGVDGGQIGIANSRSVGNVSESYSIPQVYLDNPTFAFLSRSSYGAKYLNMVIPRLAGNMACVWGGTNA